MAGLILIGLVSLGYVVFYSSFAELHIQLPFLDFPIFVGEILLFFCFALFLSKYGEESPKFTKWHYAILGYFLFVIIKATYGYLKWGPLALRHAALFYYPAFAVFGYAFFRRDFFNSRNRLILLFIIILAFTIKYHDYWTLTLVLLGCVLLNSYPNKTVKWIALLILSVVIPYRALFHTSRMMMISNALAGLCLAGALPFFSRMTRKIGFALTAALGVVIALGFYKFADHNALRSIVDFNRMAELIRSNDEQIKAKSVYFQMRERPVKLYNPQGVDIGSYSRDVVYNGEMKADSVAKAELKQAIVQDIRGKIADFSFEGVDEEAQKDIVQDVKQEVMLSLEQQVFQPAQESQETPSLSVKEVIQKRSLGSGMPLVEETVRTEPDVTAQTSKVEARKAEMRQTLLEQAQKEIQKISPNAEVFKGQPSALLNDVKQEMQVTINQLSGGKAKVVLPPKQRDWNAAQWAENNNAVFRILIWRDMMVEMFHAKQRWISGFDFGKPLRSQSLEILDWGSNDWARDGWIEPHNSYLHIIYRAGAVGILLIFSFLLILFRMIKYFFKARSLAGILLCGIIIHWFVAANFLLTFELPYTAIPIWTIYGMTFAYCYKIREIDLNGKLVV